MEVYKPDISREESEVTSERMETLEDQIELKDMIETIIMHSVMIKPAIEPLVLHLNSGSKVRLKRKREFSDLSPIKGRSPTNTLEYSISEDRISNSFLERFPVMAAASLVVSEVSRYKSSIEEENKEQVSFEVIEDQSRSVNERPVEDLSLIEKGGRLITISSLESGDKMQEVFHIHAEREDQSCVCKCLLV